MKYPVAEKPPVEAVPETNHEALLMVWFGVKLEALPTSKCRTFG